jgi:hypothetical protein
MISIIPLTYLLFLACMVTPITVLLLLQVVKFNKQKMYTSYVDDFNFNLQNQYQIANIYIDTKSWLIALTILENRLYSNIEINKSWSAKYHNAIGLILEKANTKKLSYKYYLVASQLCPEYVYATKNLKNLNLL